ncbi:MAG: PhoH family protein [Planctomycetes bacterium]|nr:PhoH family protein [Planctomycetota bacterium]
MPEATLFISQPHHIRLLFGARDEFLRQVRDSLGIDVVLRGDELRLQGEAENVERGLKVLTELQSIVERRGHLEDWQVRDVLAGNNGGGYSPDVPARASRDLPSIDLLDRARRVVPRTPGQAQYAAAIAEHDLVFCTGPAGCGKSYLAVAMALQALRTEQVRKIVLVRPAVEAGEKLGFLPGDVLAKVNPYLRPLLDALNDILDFDQVKRYMARDIIEIVPLAFMRGRTLNETFIILDEGQNTTITQIKMFLTRMGQDSKIVVNGDTSQTDLPGHVTSGLVDAIERLAHIPGVATVQLTGRDIVRHRLVRAVVDAYESDEAPRSSRKRQR